MRKFYAVAMLAAVFVPAGAEVLLNPMVGDNMVLQQKSSARLWGRATPSGKIEVRPSWADTPVIADVDADGKWQAKGSPPREVSTPRPSLSPIQPTGM